MRELLSMLLALAAIAASGADLRPCWRNLTPDARAKLAEYAKQAEGWKAHTERPQMLVPDGTPEAAFQLGNLIDRGKSMNREARGPALKAGAWNRIRLVFDQKTAILSVDGVDGAPVAVSGYEYYPSTFLLGSCARNPAFFAGELKNLSIKAR